MSNPWDIFWEAEKYTGKTALLSEPRETIAMALLRKFHYDINTEDPKLINEAAERPAAALQHLQHQGRRPAVLQHPRGPRLSQPGLVGRHDVGLLLLPAQGHAGLGAGLLEARARQGPGAERLLVDLQHHQEAGARPPVDELHPRLQQRVLELRELQRLPASDEGAQSGGSRQEQGDPREPGHLRPDRSGLWAKTRCRR